LGRQGLFGHPIKVKDYIYDVTVTIYRLVPDYVVGRSSEKKKSTLGVV